jgi:pre-mRNA-splicing factor ISY1
MREIDADYYGYLDDDDNLLVGQEEKCEAEARKLKIEEFRRNREQAAEMETDEMVPSEEEEETRAICSEDEDDQVQSIYQENTKRSHKVKKAHIPSLQEIEEAILEKKKKELLSMYVSVEMQESEAEAKKLALA